MNRRQFITTTATALSLPAVGIAERHREAPSGGAKELHRIAQWLADQWTSENTHILTAP